MNRLSTLLLLAFGGAMAQSLPQDRQRTGMVETGLRAWSVTLQNSGQPRSFGLVGGSVSDFVTDNFSAGVMFAVLDQRSPADVFCLDALGRLYFFPLQRHAPWMEARLGGLIQPREPI